MNNAELTSAWKTPEAVAIIKAHVKHAGEWLNYHHMNALREVMFAQLPEADRINANLVTSVKPRNIDEDEVKQLMRLGVLPVGLTCNGVHGFRFWRVGNAEPEEYRPGSWMHPRFWHKSDATDAEICEWLANMQIRPPAPDYHMCIISPGDPGVRPVRQVP
jgi:hypothetical protein